MYQQLLFSPRQQWCLVTVAEVKIAITLSSPALRLIGIK